MDSYWYVRMLEDAKQKLIERSIDKDEYHKILKSNNFELVEEINESEPLHGFAYYNVGNAFDLNWRKTDSTFALTSE